MKKETLNEINLKRLEESNKGPFWRNNPEIQNFPLVHYKRPIKRVEWKKKNIAGNMDSETKSQYNTTSSITINLVSEIKQSCLLFRRKVSISNIRQKYDSFKSKLHSSIGKVIESDKITKWSAGISLFAPLIFMIFYILSCGYSLPSQMIHNFSWFALVNIFFLTYIYLYNYNRILHFRYKLFILLSYVIEISFSFQIIFNHSIIIWSVFTPLILTLHFFLSRNQEKSNFQKLRNSIVNFYLGFVILGLFIFSSGITILYNYTGAINKNLSLYFLAFEYVIIIIYLTQRCLNVQRKRIVIIFIVFILSFLSLSIYSLFLIGKESTSFFIFPVLIILSEILYRNKSKLDIYFTKLEKSFSFLYTIRKNDFMLYSNLTLFSITIILFFTYPPFVIIPILLMIIPSIVFSIKSKSRLKRNVKIAKRTSNKVVKALGLPEQKLNKQLFQERLEGKNQVAAVLVLIFLIILPILFTLQSIITIDSPLIESSRINRSQRINSDKIDYNNLDFGNIDEMDSLSINDMFVTRCISSISLTESAQMFYRFYPQDDVHHVEGMLKRNFYDFLSGYLIGPQKDSYIYTDIKLDQQNLLPGTYKVQAIYSVLNWFNTHRSQPVEFMVTLEKDDLSVKGNNPYNFEVDYGAVYTIDYNDHWSVIYNGKVLNSAGKPFTNKNITLYLEKNNRYQELTTLLTDENGNFYHEEQVYGSFEINALAKIEYEGDGLYNKLVYNEYAGLETSVEGDRFFIDENKDGIPEWPFTLYDLINALQDSGENPQVEPILKFEIGKITLDKSIDKGLIFDVIFDNEYVDPVVIAYIQTRNGAQSVQVRVTDITSTSCSIFMEENDNENHNSEDIGYLIMERGSWELPDGTKVEAGKIITDNTHIHETPFGGVKVDFTQNFASTPIVLHTLDTYNNLDFTHSIIHDVNSSSFMIQQETGKSPITTTEETIGWIAIDANVNGYIEGIKYETGLINDNIADGIDESEQIITYSHSFSEIPIIVVSQESCLDDQYHSSYARGSGTYSEFSHGVYAEETQINDGGERNHDDEYFGYFVFEKEFSFEKKPDLAFQAKFNENEGDTTYDSIYNLEGNFQGTPVWTNGRYDSGLSFDSNLDYIEYGDILDDAFSYRQQFVITAWIHPLEINSIQNQNGMKNVFFTKEGIIELGVNESGYLQVYINSIEVDIYAEYGINNAIRENQWTFIALRYFKGDIDVYIGDTWYYSACGNNDEPWLISSLTVEGENLVIGADINHLSSFIGIIDDVSVFRYSINTYEIEQHKGYDTLTTVCEVLKEDGNGDWRPITIQNERINGHILFRVYALSYRKVDIDKMTFYLSTTRPNLINPEDESNWISFKEFNYNDDVYSYVMNSYDLPDNNSWYFITKAIDTEGFMVYNSYKYSNEDLAFAAIYFTNSPHFYYIDKNGRINQNSCIRFDVEEDAQPHVECVDIYIGYQNKYYKLNENTIPFIGITNNNFLYQLGLLNEWINLKELPPNEYEINFTIQLNLNYDEFGLYSYNYSLNPIILDNEGPQNIEILSFEDNPTLYNLDWEQKYDDISNYLLSFGFHYNTDDFNHSIIEYKYRSTTSNEWIKYGTIKKQDSTTNTINTNINILSLKDDIIDFRFVSYDNLGNSKIYDSITDLYIQKDMDNNIQFQVLGIEDTQIYELGEDDMISLSVDIIPFDNDIDKVKIYTLYESFYLSRSIQENLIRFSDTIKLDSIYYNIFASEFASIPINIELYQQNKLISDEIILITVTDTLFQDKINISDISYDDQISENNIIMSLETNLNTYSNAHSIPYLIKDKNPILNLYNQKDHLIKSITFSPNSDGVDSYIYNEGYIEITNNKFVLPFPSLVGENAITTINSIKIKQIEYDFMYFIDDMNGEISIKILSDINLDGIYGVSEPIEIDYSYSLSSKSNNQYLASLNFQNIKQGIYYAVSEFYDILGSISTFTIDDIIIDFSGPEIFAQFEDGCAINPNNGVISFIINDLSGVKEYNFIENIEEEGQGYWIVDGNNYTFYFNNYNYQNQLETFELRVVDNKDQVSLYEISLLFDDTEPSFILNHNPYPQYWSGLLYVDVDINDISKFNISLQIEHILSGTIYSDLQITIIEGENNNFEILLDTNQISNGKYNIKLIAIDEAGNIGNFEIADLYFDNENPRLKSITDNIFVNNELVYYNDISSILYFNDEKYINITAYDNTFDDFNWDINPTIKEQLGISQIKMYFTNPLSWEHIPIKGELSYDILTYEIDNDLMDVKNIKDIKSFRILIEDKEYRIDKFSLYQDGEKLYFEIDEEYTYLLSPENTFKLEALCYVLDKESEYSINLVYNNIYNYWSPKSVGQQYFAITDYLDISEGEEFLFWFKITDAIGIIDSSCSNDFISQKYRGIYDNKINSNGNDIFEWNLGENSNGQGIVIFGSEDYSDSTFKINISSIESTIDGMSDIDRIYIYGSENNNDFVKLGRAYYSGEDDLWNFYWNPKNPNDLPQNYYIQVLIFDNAGNTFELVDFPGTYSFEDEVDGESGIDIDFVDVDTSVPD
ncbi:MAG: hypothetical protein JXA99_05035, partial [Candidatus Lokiarchaeota archaeon]|nr:hypothetical protein [Candidatus Lokiarchaeota archaeon]